MSSNKIFKSVGLDKTTVEILLRIAQKEDRSFSGVVSRVLKDFCMGVGEEGAKDDAN